MRLWNQTRVMAMEVGKEGPCNWQTGPRRGYRRCRQQTRARQRKANARHSKKKPTGQIQAEKKRRCERSEEVVLARRATHGCCDLIPDLSTGGKGEASNHFPSFILACRCHTTSQDTAPQRMWGSTLFQRSAGLRACSRLCSGELAAHRRSAPAVFWEPFRESCSYLGAARHRRRTGAAGLIDKAGENSKRYPKPCADESPAIWGKQELGRPIYVQSPSR